MLGAIAAVLLASGPSQSELTIYNQGFGLVKEVRTINLKQGRQNVAIEDVASLIDPTSVSFHSLTNKDAFSIFEQNYQFDLINPIAILNKSVGQKIRFVRTMGNQKEILTGTLLSAPTAVVANNNSFGGSMQTYNGMVIRTDDNRIVLDPTGEVEVSSVPQGLISKPTLMWDIDAQEAGENKVELSYISHGLSWNADYVVTLTSPDKGDMQGWVTLTNSSGATWDNAKLKLLAGDVNTVNPPTLRMMSGVGGFAAGAAKAQFQEEGLFEYHLYTLQRPATVRNNETKQLTLLQGQDIPLKKKIIIDSINSRYYPSEGEIGTGDIKPQVRLEFVNNTESGLGIPLPKGKIRIYQKDKSGSVQLLGEDQIDHTARNEHVSLVVGRSFDIACSRKRTNFVRIGSSGFRESFEIEVRNRKETPEQVFVMERHWDDWRILEKSMDFKKLDSETMQFELNLKPNEVRTIKYTVETRW